MEAVFAVGGTSCWLVPLKSSNFAGADVRASMLIPSQFALPSGTIDIATGIAPEVGITGNAVCFTVGTAPARSLFDMPALPDVFIELAIEDEGVVVEPAVGEAGDAWTAWASRTTATIAAASTAPISAGRRARWAIAPPPVSGASAPRGCR